MIKNVKSRQEVLKFDFFGFRPSSRKTPMRRAALLILPLLFATYFASACSDSAATIPTIAYPETKRGDVVEEHFGQTVSDPYRWLENDVRSDKGVASWVESQNKVTNAYLDKLPGRDIFKERHLDFQRCGLKSALLQLFREFCTSRNGVIAKLRSYLR